jgi:hypothetical protein
MEALCYLCVCQLTRLSFARGMPETDNLPTRKIREHCHAFKLLPCFS